MGKRNSGEGGFFHDVNRGIWIYQLRYIDAEGNHKRKKLAAKTKREAMQKGKEFIDALNRKPNDDSKELTLGNWIINWLENYAKPNVRPRTYEKYSSCLKAYILPRYEKVLLGDLNEADLQKHFNRLLESGRADGAGLSTSTVRGTRRYLSMCIDEAVKLGFVSSNAVRLTKAPKLSKKEIAILSKSEIARLKWEDVDFEKSSLFVRRSLAHVIGRGAVFQAPKTKNSIRRILLMPEEVENLRAYKAWQKNYSDELGSLFAGHNLVFTSPLGESISPTNFSRRYFRPLLKKCKISSDFTMDTYSHVLPDMQRQAVAALQGIFQ